MNWYLLFIDMQMLVVIIAKIKGEKDYYKNFVSYVFMCILIHLSFVDLNFQLANENSKIPVGSVR